MQRICSKYSVCFWGQNHQIGSGETLQQIQTLLRHLLSLWMMNGCLSQLFQPLRPFLCPVSREGVQTVKDHLGAYSTTNQ